MSILRSPSSRASILGLVVLVAALAAPPLAADEVHLVNGRTFEGVVAVDEGEVVRIRLAHGELRLPKSRVLRIERSSSVLEEYLARRAALGPEAPAEEWLELALWARSREHPAGVREAALRAAELEPELDGLAPLMRSLGFALDDTLGRWLPHDELMRRRGWVRHDGGWITREEAAAIAEREASARRAREAERRAAATERLVTLIALQEVERVRAAEAEERAAAAAERAARSRSGVMTYVAPPYLLPPAVFLPPQPPHAPQPPPTGEPAPRGKHGVFTWDDVARRQPGSIIPLELDNR